MKENDGKLIENFGKCRDLEDIMKNVQENVGISEDLVKNVQENLRESWKMMKN